MEITPQQTSRHMDAVKYIIVCGVLARIHPMGQKNIMMIINIKISVIK